MSRYSRPSRHYSFSDNKESIRAIGDNGRIVILSNGSTYRVDPSDAFDSALWLPTEDVVVTEDKYGQTLLINTDNGETVEARQLH